MAIDYVRNIISSGYNLSKINDNFVKIEDALQDGLSRSGNGPNQMEADLDMNGEDILNVGVLDTSELKIGGQVVGTTDLPLVVLTEILEAKDEAIEAKDQSIEAKDESQAWAEGTTPGGVGTKSSKEWADYAGTILVNSLRRAATRTALKAITGQISGDPLYLTEQGREGVFIWKTGNYSSQVASDTLEGLYIKADAVASSTGAWVRAIGPNSSLNVKWWGAFGNGVSDDRPAIMAALGLLPNSGGEVFLPLGTYRVTASITLGNGTTTSVSTKTGMKLVGEGQPPLPAWFGTTFTYTGGTRILYDGPTTDNAVTVLGPLQGWGLKNLFIDGNGLASSTLYVISAQYGDCANLVIRGHTLAGLWSTSRNLATLQSALGPGQITNCDSLRNRYENTVIECASTGVNYGLVLTGQDGGSNTAFCTFDGLIINGRSNPNSKVMLVGSSDSNMIFNLQLLNHGANSIIFDYSQVSGGYWPADNIIWGGDMNGAGATIINNGTPGPLARPNKIYGMVETNTGYPVSLPNLYTDTPNRVSNIDHVGQTAAIPSTTAFTVQVSGLYKLSYYLRITAAGTSGNIQPSFIHDDGQASNIVSSGGTSPVTGGYASGEFIVYATAGSLIRYQTVFNSVVGSPSYFLRASVERL